MLQIKIPRKILSGLEVIWLKLQALEELQFVWKG
jgi:hypothetical protein